MIRNQLLEEGGPEMWKQFMAELRATHLGTAPPPGPSITERLQAAYRERVGAN